MTLYAGSVPVFARGLDMLGAMLARAGAQLGPEMAAALALRPAPGMFPACQQAATAIQFALRTAFPLAGRRVPELRGPLDAAGLARRIAKAQDLLAALDPAAFEGAETRIVRFQAGFADLDLDGAEFLRRFGLPNFYFHRAMTHVALRQAGATLGKADFDGLHAYPEGFAFG